MPEVRTTSSTGGQKGVKLARFELVPAGPHRELAEHYGRGARKYANHQWRNGYEWGKSIGALERHLNDFKAGKDYDVCSNEPDNCLFVDFEGNEFFPEEPDTCYNHTGSHHMVAVAWHAFLLLEFKDTHPEHDDRYKTIDKFVDSIDFNNYAMVDLRALDPEMPEFHDPKLESFVRLSRTSEVVPKHEQDRLLRVES